jgi:hypothetical protein
MQPKVEFRRYLIQRVQQNGSCNGVRVLKSYGTIDAIVTVPYFSSCTSTGPYTPRP